MKTTAIILAAGSGTRMNAPKPKQFLDILGAPMLSYTVRAFQESRADEIILVASEEYIPYCRENIVRAFDFSKVTQVIPGGRQRYDSVYQGILHSKGDAVLVHDGARPCIRPELIDRCIGELETHPACVVGVPVKDTIKVVGAGNMITATPDRTFLWQVQTPQCFRREILLQAMEKMYAAGDSSLTDDAMAVEKYSDCKVKMLFGDYNNIKVTTPEDVVLIEKILKENEDMYLLRDTEREEEKIC